jgi:hypothetical protein
MTANFAHRRAWLTALLFALATAALFVFQLGYQFEVGDQLQYLLLPYREIFPHFLPGDWFTWHTAHYHRTFAWVVHSVWNLSGGEAGFARGMLIAHILNMCWLGFAIWRFARALGYGLFEASVCVLMFACVRQIGLAGAVVNHAALVPADLALAPFLLACAALCEARYLALGIWLGCSGFLHANYAVLGPLTLYPIAFLQLIRARVDSRVRWEFASSLFAYLLIASPTLWLIITAFLTHDSAPGAVAVTLFVRSPHHYDLASMRPDEFYFAALLGLIASSATRIGGPGAIVSRSAWLLMAAMIAVLGLGVIGSGWHVLALARLFTWRMSIPLYALLWLISAAAVHRFARQRAFAALIFTLAGCGIACTFAQTDPLEASPWNQLPLAAAVTLLAFAVARLALTWTSSRGLSVASSLLALGLALSVTHTQLWQGAAFRAPRGLHVLDAEIEIAPKVRKLYAWVRERTPYSARFLIPPGMSQFRMQARRAVFVDWKCAPMKGDEALEWQRRMLLSMGASSFPARGYALPRAADALYYQRPLSALLNLARAEHLTHLLVRSSARANEPGVQQVFSLGDFRVFALKP